MMETISGLFRQGSTVNNERKSNIRALFIMERSKDYTSVKSKSAISSIETEKISEGRSLATYHLRYNKDNSFHTPALSTQTLGNRALSEIICLLERSTSRCVLDPKVWPRQSSVRRTRTMTSSRSRTAQCSGVAE